MRGRHWLKARQADAECVPRDQFLVPEAGSARSYRTSRCQTLYSSCPEFSTEKRSRSSLIASFERWTTISLARCFFDFRTVWQADSLAFVVLSNLIERAAQQSTTVAFLGVTGDESARSQLPSECLGGNDQVIRDFDRANFFQRYLGRSVFASEQTNRLILPLHFIEHQGIADYLLNRLVPFVSRSIDTSRGQLDSFRACTEEIFQNVKDHSGVSTGCAYASIDMNSRLRIAVSDFGVGIPNEVRTKEPHLDDRQSLLRACDEGFSTKSQKTRRGAGLTNLINFVVGAARGNMQITSGQAHLTAAPMGGAGTVRKVSKVRPTFYPGTLVALTMSTGGLRATARLSDFEEFRW